MFKCPYTGMNVPLPIYIDPAVDPQAYEAVTCPACSRPHLISKSTGQLLGDKAKE